ncbi:MAG TPA: isoprenylcysteine carboxylmethyltransferase family protein [Sphingomonadales bacterium]|nr:isoprenylcysteine carboxylmethyltransferase family protein [Sphingomonadales bacterium]
MTYFYRVFAYLGLMTLGASFIFGFRYAANAPAVNYLYNIALYAAFIGIHLAMTMPGFKKAVYGKHAGTPAERRVYIAVSVATWLAVYFLHWPLPGFGFAAPFWMAYLGVCVVLIGIFMFFEFATIPVVDGLLGVPGAAMSHSVGKETPLMTEGSYASVRHPMYRGAVIYCFGSLLIHPNAAQLLFAIMVAASFVLFIPFEEHQLLKARGSEYDAYMKKTPYRIFKGLW